MRSLFVCIFVGLICWSGYSTIQANPVPKGPEQESTDNLQKELPVDTSITIGKLDNGLKYYIRKNQKPEDRAELRLVVNAGSILEDKDQQGLAHFTEHMAFNGTENFEKQELVDYLESIGMRFGPDLNAYTSFDETVYMLQIPTDSAEIVQTAFQILEEWAHRVKFAREEVDKERGVVIEEWRLGRGAEARMRDEQFPILFKGSRYADRLPIGKKAVLDTFHYQTLTEFYDDWYRPDLMAVIAVGDFNKTNIEHLIKSHFSNLPQPPNAPQRKLYPVPDHSETYFAIATDPEATNNRVSIFYKKEVQDQGTEAAYRRSLIQSLYHGMFNQRLDELRRQADPPFLQAYSTQGRFIRSKEFYILGAAVKDNQIETGLEAILTEAARVDKYGFTQTELERQKSEMLRSIEQAYKERDKTRSRRYAAEYIRNFLTGEPIPGIEYEYQLYQKYIPTITLVQVNQLADELITDQNRVVTVNAPEKEGVTVPGKEDLQAVFNQVEQKSIEPYEDAVSEEPLISDIPGPGKIIKEKKIETIGVTEWKLSNGVRVILKPTDFQNDQVLFSAYSPGGHSLVSDQDYIAAVTAAFIINHGGVGDFNQIELEKKLAGKVVNLSPWIHSLEEGLSGSASPQDLETLFKLVYLYFTEPRKDSSAFLSYQSRIRGYLENRDANPENAFRDTVQVTMAQHHYRAQPWSEETLEEMDLQRSYAIYKNRFADASDFTFLFVGNIEPETINPFVRTYLANLPAKNRQESWRDVGIDPPQGVIQKNVRKGLEPKSRVQLIFTGPFEWSRQNRYHLNSMTHVLRIKLREVLREDKGGTYGVGVNASPSHYPDEEYRLTISFACSPDRVNELTNTVFQQIDSLKKQLPEEIYMQKVKEIQRRKHEKDLKENRYWLNALTFHYRHQENPRNILEYTKLVDQLTARDIQTAAQKYIDENNYVKVVLYPEET